MQVLTHWFVYNSMWTEILEQFIGAKKIFYEAAYQNMYPQVCLLGFVTTKISFYQNYNIKY